MTRRKFLSARGILTVAFLVAGIALSQSAVQAQKLTASANPPSGLAGVNDSYVTGSGFPAGAITGATVSFSATCGGSVVGTAPVIQVAVEGVLRRFEFLIPSTLKTGSYEVSVAGTAGTTPFNTAGSSCSALSVTASSTTLAACVPTSSLAVAVSATGPNVNAFVPFGYWDGSATGIEEVPLEGSGTAKNFATTGVVNSCAANSVTGEIVCTENSTNVDLINGSTLTTLTSGSNTFASFSGGECENCGVGINAANNTAVIAMGYSKDSSVAGVQILNLSSNTFNTPFGLANDVSEDISIDSGRNLILSPGEGGVYDLLKIGTGNALTEYSNRIGGTLDSAAEDCTTGIALATDEFSDSLFITDLTQATFTAGTPGTWTAPGQFLNLNDGGYSAGTCGVSLSPGTGHLGVVTGEFGGSAYSALELPSTSGSGTPTLADYAYVSQMPNTPDGNTFSAGFDPHTVTAYTSPNNSKSYAVFVDYAPGIANFLGVVDLACVLALPRTAGTHDVTSAAVTGTGAGSVSSCTRYVAIP
jgi:hypothetical protein